MIYRLYGYILTTNEPVVEITVRTPSGIGSDMPNSEISCAAGVDFPANVRVTVRRELYDQLTYFAIVKLWETRSSVRVR